MRVDDLDKIMNDTAHKQVGLVWDITNMWTVTKEDPAAVYQRLKKYIYHVHIKDARWNPAKNDADYKFPGEGDAAVRPIIKDLLASGYDGGFSIEPHLAVVFHDASVTASADAQYDTYVEYGRRLEKLIKSVQSESGAWKTGSPA